MGRRAGVDGSIPPRVGRDEENGHRQPLAEDERPCEPRFVAGLTEDHITELAREARQAWGRILFCRTRTGVAVRFRCRPVPAKGARDRASQEDSPRHSERGENDAQMVTRVVASPGAVAESVACSSRARAVMESRTEAID